MNEEIKLNKRQPTWNYILNDLALYSLMTKVIHSEEATNQEKFYFMYQIELLQQENAQLKDKIKDLEEWLEAMASMYENEYKDVNASEHYKCMLHKLKEN